MTATTPNLASAAQGSWRRFLETYEPFRTQLYRYCRYLFFNPDFLVDIAGELGVPVRVNGNRSWIPEAQS